MSKLSKRNEMLLINQSSVVIQIFEVGITYNVQLFTYCEKYNISLPLDSIHVNGSAFCKWLKMIFDPAVIYDTWSLRHSKGRKSMPKKHIAGMLSEIV